MSKSDEEKVVVWRNAGTRYIHRDSDAGGVMFKPGAAMVMNERERAVRGRPPGNVIEEVMTRSEAKKKYGKDPQQGE